MIILPAIGEPGDFIVIPNKYPPAGARDSCRYQVETIDYQSNPWDMWQMTAVFSPRDPT